MRRITIAVAVSGVACAGASTAWAQPAQTTAQLRLHRPQRATGLLRDLIERGLREESKRDHLAIRLGEARDRSPKLGRTFRSHR